MMTEKNKECREIIEKINANKDKIGSWKVSLGKYVEEPLYIGYYYNNETKKYRYYSTSNRLAKRMLWLDRDTEEETLQLVYERMLREKEARTDTRVKLERMIKKLRELQDSVFVYLGKYTQGDFDMGCYYDEKDKLWKIYENGERGMSVTMFTSESEDEVLAELYKKVKVRLSTVYDLRY